MQLRGSLYQSIYYCSLKATSIQAFHIVFWALASTAVARSLAAVRAAEGPNLPWIWAQLLFAEVFLGVVTSFFFNAFHECEFVAVKVDASHRFLDFSCSILKMDGRDMYGSHQTLVCAWSMQAFMGRHLQHVG